MRFHNFIIALAGISGISNAWQDIEARGNLDIADGNAHIGQTDGVARDVDLSSLRRRAPPSGKTPAKPQQRVSSSSPGTSRSSSGRTSNTGGSGAGRTSGNAAGAGVAGGRVSKSTKAARCGKPKSRITRRGEAQLDSDNVWRVNMGDICPANKVKSGQSIEVTDVSGCSAVFFFDSATGVPTTAHIEAGQETYQSRYAARTAKALGTVTSVKVCAYDKTKEAAIKAAIQTDLGTAVSITFEPYVYTGMNDRTERHKFTVQAGSTTVYHEKYHCT